MAENVERRAFIGAAGAVVAAGAVAQSARAQDAAGQGIKIVGIATSPRKGMTTAAAVQACLDAAKAAGPNIETELIDLGGMSIPGQVAAGQPLFPGQTDDFPALVPKLADPKVAGIIVGSPTYFANMSYLCKAFLDRCGAFRKKGMALSDKVAGVVAVGAARNGGQELVIRSIQTALMCQEMIIVGDGRPSTRIGAMLVSAGGDVSKDEAGLATATNLGRRVAEVALKRRGSSS
ncbi:flavodoxin family protein [bacterium]|nr:flavodoxin family protein [bacterium]